MKNAHSHEKKGLETQFQGKIPRFPKKNTRNLLEFTKRLVKSHFPPFYPSKNGSSATKLALFLEKLWIFAISAKIFVETLCFLMFFLFLQRKSAFFLSFYMIFELIMLLFLIILLVLRLEPLNLRISLHIFTFFVPIFQCFQPDSEEIHTFFNVFRSFRVLKLCETLGKCLKVWKFSEISLKIAEILLSFAGFFTICACFLITFAESQAETLWEAVFIAESRVFSCLSAVSCGDFRSQSQISMNFLVIVAILCYFYQAIRFFCEILVHFSRFSKKKPPKSRVLRWKNAKFSHFPNVFLRKRRNLCFLGDFPLIFVENLVKRMEIYSKSIDFFEIKLIIPWQNREKLEEIGRNIELLQKSRKNIKEIAVYSAESADLREILCQSHRIFVFFNEIPYISRQILSNLLETHAKRFETQEISQEITYFSEETAGKSSVFSRFACDFVKIRNCLLSSMVKSPIIGQFFKEIVSNSSKKRHISLKTVQPSSFFAEKSFSFCLKVAFFASFYDCEAMVREELGNPQEKVKQSAILLLGVARKGRFFLNPSDFLVQFGDSFLILCDESLENARFLQTFSENSFQKYQQIVELIEISLENPGEQAFTRRDFLDAVEKSRAETGNCEVFSDFLDFFKAKPANFPTFAELAEHIVIIYVGKLQEFGNLARILEEIRKNQAKTPILLFSDDENCGKFAENALKALKIVAIYGSFRDDAHFEALNVEKCAKVLVFVDKTRESAVFADFLLRKLIAKHKSSKICAVSQNSAQFLEDFARFSRKTPKFYPVLLTNRFFYKLLADYSLKNEVKLLVDALFLRSFPRNCENSQENLLCTLYISNKFANKFKTYSDLVLFCWKLKLPLIPLGISLRNSDFLENFSNKCVINPELTFKLAKGQKILILIKKDFVGNAGETREFLADNQEKNIFQTQFSSFFEGKAPKIPENLLEDYEKLSKIQPKPMEIRKKIIVSETLCKALQFSSRVFEAIAENSEKSAKAE